MYGITVYGNMLPAGAKAVQEGHGGATACEWVQAIQINIRAADRRVLDRVQWE
jgi:hypothetical protein